jgi:hypothetical protein
MTRPRIQSLSVLILTVIAIYVSPVSASTCSQDAAVWKKSIDGKKRFIPVELWTGTTWDGRKELAMPTVDAEYSHIDNPHWAYRITGPNPWLHPVLDKTFLVYERINPVVEKKTSNRPENVGLKFQRFTQNKNNTGLGRVYDSRPKDKTSDTKNDVDTFSGGFKFPLSDWTENDPKDFEFDEFPMQDKKTMAKANRIKEWISIKKLDLAVPPGKHCIEFEWKKIRLHDNKTTDHQIYTYCPCASMVKAFKPPS